MTTFSVRPVTEDQTDSPYVDVMYTLEEEEWGNVTDYQEGGFGSEGTLSKSSNCSDLASLDATASLGDPEVLAVDYGDHEDYIWVTGKSSMRIKGCSRYNAQIHYFVFLKGIKNLRNCQYKDYYGKIYAIGYYSGFYSSLKYKN